MATDGECRLTGTPQLPLGAELADHRPPVDHVDKQPGRALGERLTEGVRHAQPDLAGGRPQVVVEEATDPGLALGQGDERGQLRGERGETEELAERGDSQSEQVGTQRDGVPAEWLDVSGMLGPFVREALIVEVVCFLDALDGVEKIVEVGTVGVEGDDHAPRHGIHLGPLHRVQRFQRVEQVAGEPVGAGSPTTPDLDVCSAGARPHASPSPPVGQRREWPAG
ncbi:MAG: hypothetical protein ACYCX8_01210 [Acidimicrobiales bacterium]